MELDFIPGQFQPAAANQRQCGGGVIHALVILLLSKDAEVTDRRKSIGNYIFLTQPRPK